VLILASAVVVGGVILSLFTDTAEPPTPDGVLRVGDCVEIEADLDAREVACTGDPAVDRFVRVVVDFNSRCPSLTEPHRDQLGMGVACVSIPG
jgi:molecular chaperone DnaJ